MKRKNEFSTNSLADDSRDSDKGRTTMKTIEKHCLGVDWFSC